MKKINTILAAVSALLMLSVTSANSLEFKAGVSANGMAAYANATETLKGDGDGEGGQTGRTTNEEAVLATSFVSVFAEISSDEMMGLGLGVSYAPDVVEMDKETRHVDPVNADFGNDAAGAQQVGGEVKDLVSIYLTLPVGDTGAYVKAGYNQATLNTTETLSTGSKYEDIDLYGYTVGGGYEGTLSDMVFWRAEGTYQAWDDIAANGSEANATGDSTTNRITAELGSVTGTFSIGMKF
jgi:hypothetical protein